MSQRRGPAERRFLIWVTIWTLLGVSSWIAVMILLPVGWRWAGWLFWGIGCPLVGRYLFKRGNAIRQSELKP